MADPLSAIGGILTIMQIMQISSPVVNSIKTVKDVSKEQQIFLAEINITTTLYKPLVEFAEIDPDPWTESFQTIGKCDNEPMQQLHASLEHLKQKL